MNTICSVTLYFLCVSSNITGLRTQSDLSIYARMDTSNYIVEISLSDNIVVPDMSKMTEVCEGGGCIYYYKYCKEARGYYGCRYHIGGISYESLGGLYVKAKTKEDFVRAESELKIIPRNGGWVSAIPLSALSKSGQYEKMPTCSYRGNVPYCR